MTGNITMLSVFILDLLQTRKNTMRFTMHMYAILFILFATTGCTVKRPAPEFDPQGLTDTMQITLEVGVDVYSAGIVRNVISLDLSNLARKNLAEAVSKSFSAKGRTVMLSPVRSNVPWQPNSYGFSKLRDSVPTCGQAGNFSETGTFLRVVAIQTVKTTGLRIGMGIESPVILVFLPFFPSPVLGMAYGEGITEIWFCLFDGSDARPKWVYADTFFWGLDLSERTNAEEVAEDAYQNFLKVLANQKLH